MVPLDGSNRAERILPHAEELAHKFGAQIIFLQVVEPPYIITTSLNAVDIEELSIETMTKQAKSYLVGLIGEFREKNIEGKSIVEEGAVAHKIMEVAEREKIDLIAMASHGRSGLPRVFYGRVAASVLHLVDRPILIIRTQGIG